MEGRYHLWLKPSSKASDQFAHVIQQLALELEAAVFEPHITLLGNLEGSKAEQVSRSKELARRLSPFPINVTEPAFGEDYFYCVFLIAEMTPPLLHAHALAREIFHQEGRAHYRPHLSLVYGRYPESRKKDVIARLPASLCLPFEVSHLSLIRASSDDPKEWQEVWVRTMG
jgi:2'-5' RNA ligase